MSPAPGTRLGPYEILAPLGAGGMGEVYRARDTRLDRIVAVKVLPAHLSAHPEVRQRFEREARAVSSLNHPHICTLHDVGHHEGIDYLVMEMIEGETLADRLKRGPLPAPEMLRLAIQIADALEKAHRGGIVHRDLKPGNIMLTKSGAKLLDFGLARSTGLAGSPGSQSLSPTMSQPLTAEGTIVGTFQYMAPEQLEGKEADSRSDIFAFGAVMYEMATGRRAFEGKTQASLIASIMSAAPAPIAALAPAAPPALERVVGQCLAKDPEERWQSAGDLRRELTWLAGSGLESGPVPAAGTATRESRERLAWTIAAVASLSALAIGLAPALWNPHPPRRIVASIDFPEHTSLSTLSGPMALSPDGRQIAFVARSAEGKDFLWIRSLDDGTSRSLPGTEDASAPFWSPDGRAVGFFAQAKMKKVDLAGGNPEILAPAPRTRGASWGKDGTILFSPDSFSPILRIPADGGEPVAVTSEAQANSIYAFPSFLPGGRHFLYTLNGGFAAGQKSGIYVDSIDAKEHHLLLPVLSNALYAPPGYLIYARDGSLRAQLFDAARLELRGEPAILADGVLYDPLLTGYSFSVSESGLLSYLVGAAVKRTQFTWLDRSGRRIETTGEPGLLYSPRLSHDGRRIAYDQSDPSTNSGDIWVLDLERRVSSRLTYDPGNESAPIWSPDDERILFYRNVAGRGDLFVVSSSGTGSAESVLSNEARNRPADWSRDGRHILFSSNGKNSEGQADLWIYSIEEKKTSPWLQTPFNEWGARLSPDGRWVAYCSDESGRMEVYVRGFSPPGGKWRISADGGDSPTWRGDGKEIFYISSNNSLMSVAIQAGAAFGAETPKSLFQVPRLQFGGTTAQYGVASDGQRFLLALQVGDESRTPITLVTNWASGIRK